MGTVLHLRTIRLQSRGVKQKLNGTVKVERRLVGLPWAAEVVRGWALLRVGSSFDPFRCRRWSSWQRTCRATPPARARPQAWATYPPPCPSGEVF